MEAPNARGVGENWHLSTNNSLWLENVDRRKCCQLSLVADLSHWASTFVCSTFAVMQHIAWVRQRRLILVCAVFSWRGWESGRVSLPTLPTAMAAMRRRQTCHTILRCAARTRRPREKGNGWSRWKPKNVAWQSWKLRRFARATCYGL